MPAYGEDEGESEFGLVGVVEQGDLRKFLGTAQIKPRPALFLGGFGCEFTTHGGLSRQLRMRTNEGQFRVVAGLRDTTCHGLLQRVRREKRTMRGGLARYPR